MPLNPMDDFTFKHVDQVGTNLTGDPATVKAELDSQAVALRAFINETLIPALKSAIDGDSGADILGMTPIAETGQNATAQSIIEALITRLKATTDGVSGADLIGVTGINGLDGATVQALIESLKSYLDSDFTTKDEISNNRKLSATGDFSGTWNGVPMTAAEPGLSSAFDAHLADTVQYNIRQERNGDESWNVTLQRIVDNIDESKINLVLIPLDITLTNTVNVNKKNIMLSGTGKIISGDFIGLKVSNAITYYPVDSYSGNTITTPNVANFTVGDVINLKGDAVSIFSVVVSISGNVITIADNIPFTIGGVLQLGKSVNMNCRIEGLRFEKNVPTTNDDIQITLCHNTVVTECSFRNAKGVTVSRAAYCSVADNEFENTGMSTILYDASYVDVLHNKYRNFTHGVKCQYPYAVRVLKNDLQNGTDKSYSIGIEIASTSGIDKACFNEVSFNRVINAQQGVSGSAIGGIHLNFNANHNKVTNNICEENGIGIYLENLCKNNIITDNICNYNGGYYGVGIELDWDCHYNIISHNQCNNNSGSTTADESCGIEVRGSVLSGHPCKNNTITGNVAMNNGKAGIIVNGQMNVCKGNTLVNNGSDLAFAERADLLIRELYDSDISGNKIDSFVAKYALLSKTNIRNSYMGNKINAGNSNYNAVKIQGTIDTVNFENNSIKSDATSNHIILDGVDATGKNMICDKNLIIASANGWKAIQLTFFVTYSLFKNRLLGANTSVVVGNSSNDISTL